MKRYLMIEDIGAGSFGFVYKMKDQKTGKVVAVKKVKPASLKHLGLDIRELVRKIKIGTNVLKQCDHKNIIKLLDEYQKGQKELYFVMDFCEGGSLRDYVFEEGLLPEITARKLAVQVKDALLYMKSKEVSHRDLKPEHVLLTEQSENALVKLTGFGESQFKKLDSNGVTVYKTATTSGLYAAPELLAKDGIATADSFRSNVDLWALGVMIYEMVTGDVPFQQENGKTLLEVIQTSKVNVEDIPVQRDCKELILGLLQPSESRKWSILKSNGWIKSCK